MVMYSYGHGIWHMALMSLRSRSHVKESVILTRADHLFIHNYIRSLLNNILRSILMVRTGLEPALRWSDFHKRITPGLQLIY